MNTKQMKTLEINLYSFNELSAKGKKQAIEKFREGNNEDRWFIDEANKTFEKFCDIFNINWSDFDYLEMYRSHYSFNLEDQILELSGQRLATYLWNNYRSDIFKGKYYGSFVTEKKITHPCIKQSLLNGGENKGKYFTAYYSRITKTEDCVLTGVCYDYSILKPIYEFLNKPTNEDFRDLLEDCLHSIAKDVQNECEYQDSDEAIIETIEANSYTFESDGTLNNG